MQQSTILRVLPVVPNKSEGIMQKLAEAESPGILLGDIEVSFDTASLPIDFETIEEMEYFRAGQPDLVLIGARPAVGKSALLCQIAYNLSKHSNVHLFSLEMDRKQIKRRLVALQAESSIKILRNMSVGDIRRAAEAVRQCKLFIDDTNGLDVNTLCSRVLSRHRHHPVSAVFVDYLQIVGQAGRSKNEEVDTVAKKLKELALEIKAPVIAAAQMNRNIEGRVTNARNKDVVEPMMSDFADSSGLEKWADVAIFLHKRFVNGVPSPNQVGFFVKKNRHGQVKDILLHFEPTILKFFDRGLLEAQGI